LAPVNNADSPFGSPKRSNCANARASLLAITVRDY
jgi:hypothetical protein